MKGVPFSLLPLGKEEDENDLEKELGVIDERFASMNTLPESKQSSRVAQFFRNIVFHGHIFFKSKSAATQTALFVSKFMANVLLKLFQTT